MKTFLWNLILALAWSALRGELNFTNLFLGFGLGYFILRFTQPPKRKPQYFAKFPKVLGLLFFFLYELVLSSLRVAYEVLRPHWKMNPAIVGIPLKAESDFEITMLANLITLTPGTLSLDVSTDRKMLYIHSMYLKNVKSLRREITRGFEKRILEVTR